MTRKTIRLHWQDWYSRPATAKECRAHQAWLYKELHTWVTERSANAEDAEVRLDDIMNQARLDYGVDGDIANDSETLSAIVKTVMKLKDNLRSRYEKRNRVAETKAYYGIDKPKNKLKSVGNKKLKEFQNVT